MPTAIRVLSRLQDLDDFQGALTDGFFVRWNNAAQKFELAASGGGVTDHGALTGLADDDHPQYATNVELDAHTGNTSNPHAVTAVQVGALTQAQSDALYSVLAHNHTGVYVPVAQVTGGGVLATGGFTLTVPATGTAALLEASNAFVAAQGVKVADAATNTTTVVATLGHNSSATPLALFGTGLLFQGKSATVADRDIARISARWLAVTDVSRQGRIVIETAAAGGVLADVASFSVGTMGNLMSLGTAGNVDNGSIACLNNVSTFSTFASHVFKVFIGAAYAEAFRILGNAAAPNFGFMTATQFGGGLGVIGIKDANTVPSTNPTGGGVLYSEGGALKWRSSAGTVTTIAPV